MIVAKRLFKSNNIPEDRIWYGRKDLDDALTYQWITYYSYSKISLEESFDISYFLPINNLSGNVTYFVYDNDRYSFNTFDDFHQKIVRIKSNSFQEMLEAIEKL